MFRFGDANALYGLLLIPLLGVFLWFADNARRRALERFGDSELVRRLTETVSQRARILKPLLLVTGVAFLVASLARPQFGTRVETVRREGKDVVVAVDLSRSMLAEDVAPSRLQRAKLEILRLIERLEGDRIGLVAFAGQAFVQSPLTTDYAAASLFLNAMDVDLVPVQGTDLGKALTVSIDSFDDEVREHRVLIVVTDGEDHEGEVEAATARAVELGVRVFTVGIGSTEGVPIPEIDERGRRQGFKRDADGNVVTTRLDETTLRRVADATGGSFYRSTPQIGELDALVEDIEAVGGREIDAREVTQFEEQFQIFLGLAILLLIIESLLPERRKLTQAWSGRLQ